MHLLAFFDFCLNVSYFLKLFAQLSLIRHVYNNPERRKRATIVCFLKRKKKLQGACADVVAVPCKRAQHCCATLRRSQNSRNVGTCWAKSLPGFKLYATTANKCKTLLWFHANGRNKSQHCWAQQCWVLLANNVGSVCMGLKARSNGCNIAQHCWTQHVWQCLIVLGALFFYKLYSPMIKC